MPPTNAREIREKIDAAGSGAAVLPAQGGRFHRADTPPKADLVATIEHNIAHLEAKRPEFSVYVADYTSEDVDAVTREYRQHKWLVIAYGTDHALPPVGNRPVSFLRFKLA